MSKLDVSIIDLIAAHLSEQSIWCKIYSSPLSYDASAYIYFITHYGGGTIHQEDTCIRVITPIEVQCFDLTDSQSLAKLVKYIKTRQTK